MELIIKNYKSKNHEGGVPWTDLIVYGPGYLTRRLGETDSDDDFYDGDWLGKYFDEFF